MSGSESIAVVVLDTLRYDLFEEYFDWLPGRSFSNAYSTSHWTVPAHGSLFTGQYPSENGVHSRSLTLDCDTPTIAEELQRAGYRTRKYSANLNIHVWDGWDRGFDINIGPDELKSKYGKKTLDFQRIMSNSDKSGKLLYLSLVLECVRSECSTVYSLLEGMHRFSRDHKDGGAASMLRELQESSFGDEEFLFVNLMDAHVPYYPPKKYRRVDTEVSTKNWEPFLDGISNLSEINMAYEDSVNFLSDMYKQIFEELRDKFKYVITLSDHGEMLGEYGMIDHAHGVYPQVSHIPVVISGNSLHDEVVDEPVSLLDVHATIADLSGVEVNSRGQSLIQEIQPQNRLVEYHGFSPWLKEKFLQEGVTEQEYKRLNEPLRGFVDEEGHYRFQTYDRGFVDETNSGQNSEDQEEILCEMIAQLDIRDVNTSRDSIDEDVMSHLERLGYA